MNKIIEGVLRERRPAVISCFDEFSVPNGAVERKRALRIADEVGDYDPAGRFAYTMYACMMAVGDESLSDSEVYVFYMRHLGKHFGKSEDKSFVKFMRTVNGVSTENTKAVSLLKAAMRYKEQSFEDRAILEIRKAFIGSDMFKKSLDDLTDTVQNGLMPLMIDSKFPFHPVTDGIIQRLKRLTEDYISKYGEGELHGWADRLDEAISEADEEDMAGRLREVCAPDSPLIRMLYSVDEELGEAVKNGLYDNAGDIVKGMIKIRKIGALLTALYMLIGSGLMGLKENRVLSDKIAVAVASSSQAADRNTGILSLDKMELDEFSVTMNRN